jgi:A/G-specific adenine glycosylase
MNVSASLAHFDLKGFQKALVSWEEINGRIFPWRVTKNPYHILIAETFLHRTQAKQIEGIYLDFIRKYPDINTLANANYNELEKSLFSLGLNWRIKLLYTMAKEIKSKFDGQIPIEKSKLLSLPGIGDYIASAIRCFAYNQKDAIVDTNVMRVITRLFSIPFRDSLRRNSEFKLLAQALVYSEKARLYNLGMLDLAYLICKPKKPECDICPIRKYCQFATKL